jgi:hypothetical protein
MSTMRTLSIQAARLLVLVVSLHFSQVHAALINLAWDPSPDAATPGKVAGYKVYYGLENFIAPNATNAAFVSVPVGLSTSATLSNIIGGATYYFAVVSVDENGVESDFSNLATYLTPPEVPDLPPIGGSIPGTNTGGSGVPNFPPSTPTQVNLIGMLPRLWLYPTNGQALLALQGTVGATFSIQYSTNPAIAESWTTITNLKLTLPAPNANPNPGTTLEKAFIPALEAYQDPNPVDGTIRYYRIYMPLGYAVLADQVLTAQGFDTRLIAVRCPGRNGYIVCYVTQEAAYLDYNNVTYIVKLESSGPTIREVATKVAATLQQNWTSASEFTVGDDGTKFLFATVVQTDHPLTDPPLGVPRVASSTILIDF